jgi:sugar phosphate permease
VRWLIFVMACLASGINYLHRYSWGAVRPYLQEEYGLTDGQCGWLDSAFNLTYFLGQFPGGLAGDALGPRVVIPVVAVLWSLVVAAPGFVVSFRDLYIVRLLFGATQAPAYPNLGKVTQSWFPLSVRTSVQGSVSSFSGRAGAALAPVVVASLLIGKMGLTWQSALWTVAILGFVFAAVFWLLFRDQPAEHPWANAAEVELIDSGEATATDSSQVRFRWTRANRVNLGVFCSASFCSTFADNLFVFWMPTFLAIEKGFDPVSMGMYASLPLLGGAFGGLFGGFLNDALIRFTGNRRLARSLVACTGKIIAAILIGVSLMPDDGRLVMVVLFFCKFFSDWSQPTWWGTVTDIGGPAAGRVFGMVNTVGSMGAFAAGPAMGYVKQYFGWSALFTFVGAVYILTAIFWGCVNCTQKLVVVESDES